MAITKTTKIQSVTVYPPVTNPGAPTMSVDLLDTWDDPEDNELPLSKTRTIVRGRAVPEVDGIERTPLDDLPELAQVIGNAIWWYD